MKKLFLFAGIAAAFLVIRVSNVNAQTSGTTGFWDLKGNSNTDETINYVGTSDQHPLVFRTVGTERMRINTSGSVGIGTSSPSYLFHVKNTTSLRSAYFHNDFNSSSTKYGIYNDVTGTGTGGRYGIFNSAIASSSSTKTAYGIYNTLNNPGSGLSYGVVSMLTGGSNQSVGILNEITPGKTSAASNFGIWNIVTSPGSGPTWGIYSDASDSANGNVHGVYGTATSTGNGKCYGVHGAASGKTGSKCYGIFGEASGDGDLWAGYFSGSKTFAGELRIGSEKGATGYKLCVDGKAICEELRVLDSSDWPDYVFDKDYKLPSLDAIAKQIKETKHLPGIPSACEMEEEGIDVGDMQKKLMEKIEELTLYTIDLNDRVKSLEKENTDLKAGIINDNK